MKRNIKIFFYHFIEFLWDFIFTESITLAVSLVFRLFPDTNNSVYLIGLLLGLAWAMYIVNYQNTYY